VLAALSYECMRPSATSVCSLKLLVHAALRAELGELEVDAEKLEQEQLQYMQMVIVWLSLWMQTKSMFATIEMI
jgi:hypothetical protein